MKTLSKHQYIFMLGRNQSLAAAEIIAALKAKSIIPAAMQIEESFFLVSLNQPLPDYFLNNLGGTERIAKIISHFPSFPSPPNIATSIISFLTPGKINLGINLPNIPRPKLKTTAIEIKKELKKHGYSTRFILPGKGSRLNTAQVLFNKLIHLPNADVTVAKINRKYFLARTVQIQDISAYQLRDTDRPKRTMKVGLMPPKLAQIMLNLTTKPNNAQKPLVVLDPFCGMGTILQEGWLMGHQMIGSDISSTMISSAQSNLLWLSSNFSINEKLRPKIFMHDTTKPFDEFSNNSFDAIVTEPHLGPPLSSPLLADNFESHTKALFMLYQKTFANLWPLLKNNASLLFIFPAFRLKNMSADTYKQVPQQLLDSIAKLGYIQQHLIPDSITNLIANKSAMSVLYSRPGAMVARQLTLWKKVT